MKFSTFYFSGTGNTEWAVKEFNRIITERGHDVDAISIDGIDARKSSFLVETVRNSDFIGFANPIYGGNIPPVMRIFISKLIKAFADETEWSKPVYIINTFAYINGFGPFCAGKLLKNTGFKMISYVNIQLCNNISTPNLKVKKMNQEKLNKRKLVAIGELQKAAGMILEGKRHITGRGLYLIPNILIRKISKKAIEDNYKVFSVEKNSCKRCMLCADKCPTKSIEYKDNSFRFLPTCTACMRCYNNCPTYSILFNGKYADPNIYERYRGPDAVKN
jgi:NAD-dependent dihydropyrimidine dehydrogenase PreA subunit